MRMSRAFVPTLREDPSDADTAGHRLLVRAGYIQTMGSGLVSLLPLGRRVFAKVEAILRRAMDERGCQEVQMPLVQPAELWKRSGRWDSVGPEMVRLEDRRGTPLCLAMTHEEAVTDLVRGRIRSYRELPVCLYQIHVKFRDEPRARAGLIRVREFAMKDAYSFHADEGCLDAFYLRMYDAYHEAFRRAGVDAVAVRSDTGMMGGSQAHEFMAITPIGEDTLVLCAGCGYAANRQVASARRPAPSTEDPLPCEPVETPGCRTIAEVAKFLGVPEARTAKAVFFAREDGMLVFALVRGDEEVNETKLANRVGARQLRPATEEEIRAAGAEPGFASPVGLRGPVLVAVDRLVAGTPNLVGGANRVDFHLRNLCFGRDFDTAPELVADLVSVQEGDPCERCGGPLRLERGIEVGNIFKLGTRYSEAMGATFRDREGRHHPLVMGCYGIGPGRLVGTAAELHRDEAGLCWPITLAPYEVHLVSLPGKDDACREAADRIYEELVAAGLEVLYDDRTASPGEKFADADLVGIPIRVTVGNRSLRDGTAELRRRGSGESTAVRLEALVQETLRLRELLLAGIETRVAAGRQDP